MKTTAHSDFVGDDSTAVNNTAAKDTAGSALRADLFNDPIKFLKALDDNRQLISSNGDMTKEQLLDYSEHGADPSVREVAKLGYEYFDQLKKFAGIPYSGNNPGLNHDDLETDIALESGSVRGKIASAILDDVGWATLYGFGSLMMAGATDMHANVFPPAAVAAGALSATMAGGAFYFGAGTVNDPRKIFAASKEERAFFRSLPEFQQH